MWPAVPTTRDVHRDFNRRAFAVPLLSLTAGLLDGPLADRQDQSRVFGDANELGGTHDVLSAAVPANQRFHSGDRLGAQVELRLIVKDELVTLQRLVQRGLQCESFRRLSSQERRAELVAVSPCFFCLV